MSTVEMTVAGMPALMSRLLEMSAALPPATVKGILEEAAEPILVSAREKVHKRTRKLEGAIIKSKPHVGDKGMRIKVLVPRGEGVAYGIPLEFGHRNRDGTITPPYPFLSTAYAENRDEAYRKIREGVAEAIGRGGGGG